VGHYARILRTSAVTGGSTALTMLIGLGAVKVAALMIGPDGIGELRLFQAAIGMVVAVTGLGLISSTARAIAQSEAAGDSERSRTVSAALRRLTFALGLAGWVLTAACSIPLSLWVFDDSRHATSFALLGAFVLAETLRGGRMASVWGLGRVGLIARINVATAIAGAAASVAFYTLLGNQGIVPALLASSFLGLAITVSMARDPRLGAPPKLSWRDCLAEGRQLIGVGAATMLSGLLTSLVATAVGAMLVHQLGLRASGLYAAAWGISGLFANFVLNAMSVDYFPRLSAASGEHEAARIVNEQTEIGVLLSIPGLVATICFAPWVIQACYSAEFLDATGLLVWLVLGVFGRVTSWPLGYVLVAKGDTRTFMVVEIGSAIANIALVYGGVWLFGLRGAGIGLFASYVAYNIGLLLVLGSRHGITWSRAVLRLALLGLCLAGAAVAVSSTLPVAPGAIAGVLLSLCSGALSVKGLAVRLGHDHRIVRRILAIPGARLVLGASKAAARG
jgi:antigen flippase